MNLQCESVCIGKAGEDKFLPRIPPPLLFFLFILSSHPHNNFFWTKAARVWFSSWSLYVEACVCRCLTTWRSPVTSSRQSELVPLPRDCRLSCFHIITMYCFEICNSSSRFSNSSFGLRPTVQGLHVQPSI